MATFRYSLNSAPQAYNDGSGVIGHAIHAEYAENGDWLVVPGRSKTIVIPADELQAVMDMPHLTAGQRAAKANAYKQALADNLNTQNEPVVGWGIAQLQALVDANNAALTEATRADDFIRVTLNQDYPVRFSL